MNSMVKNTRGVSVGRATVTLQVPLEPRWGRMEMSLLWSIASCHTLQICVPRFLKEGEEEKHFGPVRKKLVFHLNPVLLKTIPSLLRSACGIQRCFPFIWGLLTTLQIVLWRILLLDVI